MGSTVFDPQRNSLPGKHSSAPVQRETFNMRRVATLSALTLALVVMGGLPARAEDKAANVLRVCADPNNLPFSNREGAGFENKLAELVAKKLEMSVSYTWWAQRRGFIRNTLRA